MARLDRSRAARGQLARMFIHMIMRGGRDPNRRYDGGQRGDSETDDGFIPYLLTPCDNFDGNRRNRLGAPPRGDRARLHQNYHTPKLSGGSLGRLSWWHGGPVSLEPPCHHTRRPLCMESCTGCTAQPADSSHSRSEQGTTRSACRPRHPSLRSSRRGCTACTRRLVAATPQPPSSRGYES